MTEQNFEAMRRAMVESQLRTTGVNDPRVVAAMAETPREAFVPADRRAVAYTDRPVPLCGGRSLNAPEATGRLLTAAAVKTGERVLLIGAGAGYTAALLQKLGAHVVAVEENAELAAQVRAAGFELVEGPLADGAPTTGPYDLIVIDGLIEQLPDTLIAQLKDGGRLVCALLERGSSRLALGRKAGTGFGFDLFADCEAAPIPGFDRPESFVF